MKKLFGLILSIAIFAAATPTAFASGAYGGQTSTCQIVYGGGQVCNAQVKFTINKLVQRPGKGGGDYIENLTVNDQRYAPSENVNFKIVVENTGDHDITNLNVVDNFPQFLTFVAGVGNSNVGASKINFVIGKLAKGQKIEYVITAKTADVGNLPADQAITCVTNNVVATSTDGSVASDNSQLCIEKNIAVPAPEIMVKTQVQSIPSTGPETDILMGLMGSGAFGYFLRKKFN